MKTAVIAVVMTLVLACSSIAMAADSLPYNRLIADQIAADVKANFSKTQYQLVIDLLDFNTDGKFIYYDVFWPAVE